MDIETWSKLLGKSQDDKAVQAALAGAGVKKIPKLPKDDVIVIVDLKGHGMWLNLIDEAFLKKLDDQDIGEGPLILSGVGAYLERRKNRDLYKSTLPYNLAAGMVRAEVRKTLGLPTSSDDDVPFDTWLRDGLEVIVGYTKDLRLAHVNLQMPS